MDYMETVSSLKTSLRRQEVEFENTLILNPVENVPEFRILEPCSSFLHGLYNTDTPRTSTQKIESKIQFAGRSQITEDVNSVYKMWSSLIGGEAISMRLLSGLHAHIVLFMSITEIGQKVLALPEKAGGHVSSYAILKRLGLQVIDIPYLCEQMKIDKEKCLETIEKYHPDIILVDRSEGLLYEDLTWLGQFKTNYPCYRIFDASQYLTNIISHDYKSPFDMGFDLILSTLHKNFPGPQRAFVCAKKADVIWDRLRKGISTFVSNMHVFSIYSAGLALENLDAINLLSKNMLSNACQLENALRDTQVPVVTRETTLGSPPTHHCWIGPLEKNDAFKLFCTLERIGILTNYRLLPYEIGYGLRLGLSASTKSGLQSQDIPELASIISDAFQKDYTDGLAAHAHQFIKRIKNN